MKPKKSTNNKARATRATKTATTATLQRAWQFAAGKLASVSALQNGQVR
ncbi:MAG: hypothetical protein II917_10590 [Synergistaceae bacterium]|nr:hypothetical protein [Synergistaceae bacterium]